MDLKEKAITILSLLTIVISIIGLADSGYVTYEKLSGVVPACGAEFSCDTVLSSSYAYIGPIPISAFGFLFYGFMFVLGVLHYLDIPLTTTHLFKKNLTKIKAQAPVIISKHVPFIHEYLKNEPWQKIGFLSSIPGFLFTLYLVFIMAFVLEAWCLFCIVSAASSTSLFLLHSGLRYVYRATTK